MLYSLVFSTIFQVPMTFLFLGLTIIYDVAASSDSTLQNSLEKKPLQTATFPNGFEVYSYAFLLFICYNISYCVKMIFWWELELVCP